MPSRRLNPHHVKLHRTYAVGELAARLGVHKNTVRHWQRDGLAAIDGGRPVLFHGGSVRAFLAARNAARKRPCPPGTFYCLRCREPRRPALGMVDYVALTAEAGNLRALCAGCEGIVHRRAQRASLAAVMPGVAVRMEGAAPRLEGCSSSSLNSDLKGCARP